MSAGQGYASEDELRNLSVTLAQISQIRSSLSQLFRETEGTLLGMAQTSRKWVQKREETDKESGDIQLALDVVYAVDNNLRTIITNLQQGINQEEPDRYIDSLAYALTIQDKAEEVELEGNDRLVEMYNQLDDAVKFGVTEVTRIWPVELSQQDKNVRRLKAINSIFKKLKITDPYYEVSKIILMKMEKQLEAGIAGVIASVSSLEQTSKELESFLGDPNVTGKIFRNLLRKLAEGIFNIHFKPFLMKFSELPITEKKSFIEGVDKAYSVLRELEGKMDIEIMMNSMGTFYSGLLDYMNNFGPNLEKSYATKTDQAFEASTKVLLDILALLDGYAGSFSVFISKKNLAPDALEFAVKITSNFVRILKSKSDSLKVKSVLHSHLFAIKSIELINQELVILKKVSLKLKPALEKTMQNALKVYLHYCWAHSINLKLDKSNKPQELELRKPKGNNSTDIWRCFPCLRKEHGNSD